MRLTAVIGSERLRVPAEPDSTVGWLYGEINRRWSRLPGHNSERLRIRELRTSDNVRLDSDDQLMAVMHDGDTVLVILEGAWGGGLPDLGVGDLIQHYYLLALIGEGTYARVFRAQDLNLARSVAVKVLKKDKANEVNMRRFLREAEVLAMMSGNPFIVTVHDFGRTRAGHLYIVMELLKGQPLNVVIDERIAKKQPFTSLECIHILSPILRGLQHAHKHTPAIIHRDLKPDNIWLNEMPGRNNSTATVSVSSSSSPSSMSIMDYAAKIMDFGIAVHDDLTHATLAAGTRMYASPEQVRKNSKLDGRSDIWSVGVILYQMLTLLVDVPFDPIDINLNNSANQLNIVPDVRQHALTKISDNMADIVMRALQKDPKDRWASADEMSDALYREEAAILTDPIARAVTSSDEFLASQQRQLAGRRRATTANLSVPIMPTNSASSSSIPPHSSSPPSSVAVTALADVQPSPSSPAATPPAPVPAAVIVAAPKVSEEVVVRRRGASPFGQNPFTPNETSASATDCCPCPSFYPPPDSTAGILRRARLLSKL